MKKYFLNYDECLSNDFVLSNGGKKRQLLRSDLEDWRITFADTGLNSNIGQRLKAVEKYVRDDDMFLANYSDAVTDLNLQEQIEFFTRSNKTGCFLAVRPFYTFHVVSLHNNGSVESIKPVSQSDIRINGGFFIFRKGIFSHINEGEELVNEPFQRLIEKQELVGYRYDGFWANMDTYKDKQQLDELAATDRAPWQIWKHSSF
jgi:glucose-1-phosphate cytidylyltransferase